DPGDRAGCGEGMTFRGDGSFIRVTSAAKAEVPADLPAGINACSTLRALTACCTSWEINACSPSQAQCPCDRGQTLIHTPKAGFEPPHTLSPMMRCTSGRFCNVRADSIR